MHVIMGASGGGKSSLLKTLSGVWKPRTGKLLMEERPVWMRSDYKQDRQLISRVGFAFQNNALFTSLGVLENLCLPHRQKFPQISEADRKKLAIEWLEKVGLGHAVAQMPHELSGGMQKRLALARTLILNPDYIFLDDPTAGLDPITSTQISELLSNLLKGRDSLVVVVTNDPDRAKDWGPNIHYLHQGHFYTRENADYQKIAEIYQ